MCVCCGVDVGLLGHCDALGGAGGGAGLRLNTHVGTHTFSCPPSEPLHNTTTTRVLYHPRVGGIAPVPSHIPPLALGSLYTALMGPCARLRGPSPHTRARAYTHYRFGCHRDVFLYVLLLDFARDCCDASSITHIMHFQCCQVPLITDG